MMKLACYITILLSLLPQTASAFCFRSFEVRHGLSDNSVLDIARDSTGYLWIATQSGLDRFDGYRFRPIPLRYSDFKSPPREIAVDGSNNIFVMTSDSLYTCFRGMLVPPTASPALSALPFSWDKANRVTPDGERGLWIFKPDSLLYFDRTRNTVSSSPLLFRPQDSEPYADGLILLSPDGNIYLRDRNDRRLRKLTTDATHHARIRVIGSRCLLFDGLRPGVDILNLRNPGSSLRPYGLFKDIIVKDIAADPAGNIFFGTNNGGLMICNRADSLIKAVRYADAPYSLASNHISSLFIDRELLVAGSSKRGLSAAPLSSPDFRICSAGIESDITFLHYDTDGKLIVGFDGGGLALYSGIGTGSPTRLFTVADSKLPSDLVVGMSQGSGRRLFGTYGGGIFALDEDRITPIGTPEGTRFCRHIISMPAYTWVGTFRDGLFSLSGKHFDIGNSCLPSNCITGLALNEDRIIVATSAGISVLDPAAEDLKPCPSRQLASASVSVLFSDSRNLLWIGTSSGITVTDGDFHEIASLSVHDGLTSDRIRAITEDSAGNIWATTANGISRISPLPAEGNDRQHYDFSIRSFTENDGLGDISFNRYALTCTPGGLVLAGGFGKYLVIDTGRLTTVPAASGRVHITGLYVNGLLAGPESGLRDADIVIEENSGEIISVETDFDNSLSLSLSTLFPADAGTVRFEYRFGNETVWSLSPSEILVLGQLPSGRHELLLRVAGRDAVTRLQIIVNPPFYRSDAAFAIYALLLILVALYIRRRIMKGHAKALGEQRIENAIARIENTPVTPDDRFITDAKNIIEAHLDREDFSVEKLSELMNMSRSNLYKKMTAVTGRTPLEFIRTIRPREGRRLLDSGESSVSQIAYRIGMSPKQFSKYFKDETGCTPSQYLKRDLPDTGPGLKPSDGGNTPDPRP